MMKSRVHPKYKTPYCPIGRPTPSRRREGRYRPRMLTDCLPLRALLLTTIGWVSREQQRTINYLVEENRVLKEQLGPAGFD